MSDFFPWNDRYCTGINVIDAQHRKLVEIINGLHAAMEKDQAKEIMGGLLDALIQYTVVHFSAEEGLLKFHGYPDHAAHHGEHEVFTRTVIRLQEQFKAGKSGMTIQGANFLKKWLVDHILGTDMKYVPYLIGKGVK
jgi:hemerythrin-like metal-binding protein